MGNAGMIVTSKGEYARRISEEAGVTFNPEVDICLARVEDDVLYGGVVFQGYTGRSIQIHMAGFTKNWANRDMIWVAFDYPFNQLKCERIIGQVSEGKPDVLEIDLKLGFKIVAKVEKVYPDGACVVLAMDRDECKWLKLKPKGLSAGSEG